MKEETALKLLELATHLASAAIGQKNFNSKTRPPSIEGILEDCLQAVQAHLHDMTKSG